MAFNPQPKPIKQEKKTKKNNIPHQSEKGKENSDLYSFLAKKFKEEHGKCMVCKAKDTTDVHHIKKRRGYADFWAKWMDIPLLLDIRYWLACCRDCHNEIENNPEWAYKKGYSQKNN